MEQKTPIPKQVYTSAVKVYLYDKQAEDGDKTIVREWANKRYGDKAPTSLYNCAFWAISLVANYGIA